MPYREEKYKPLDWQSKTFPNKHLHLIDNKQDITSLAIKYAISKIHWFVPVHEA